MKNIFTFILASAFFASCSSNDSYTIEGTVVDDAINGEMVYLFDYNTNRDIDSTLVTDRKFTFKGSFESPTILAIEDDNDTYYATVFSENRDIEVELSPKSTVSSDGINAEYQKMYHELSSAYKKVLSVRDSLSNAYPNMTDLNKAIKGSLELKESQRNFKQIYHSFLATNRDNMLGVYCAQSIIKDSDVTLEKADSILNELTLAQSYAPIMRVYNRIKAVEQTKPGSKFTDFPAENVDGTAAKLSDYVGKGEYVLVDFWATWCGPCTREIPHLKYLHENYPELVVLGVNVWEEDKSKFQPYIEEKGIQWSMLYSGEDNTATDLYGIGSIPTIILFDPQGVIVDRTLRGEDMKQKIADIFKR